MLNFLDSLERFLKKELNFFRIHLTVFIITPLIFSGVFFASNGQFHVPYIDALFLCYSAMTVTGLSTVNLSQLTGWQQSILFILMLLGDQSLVSLVMVLVRKHYFRTECEYLVTPKRPIRKQEISPPFNQHRADEVETGASEKNDAAQEIVITRPTPAATTEAMESNAEKVSQPLSDPALGPEQEHGVLHDVSSFTSSPRAVENPLELTPTQNTIRFDDARSNAVLARRRMASAKRTSTILTANMAEHADINKAPPHRDTGFGGFPSPLDLLPGFLRRFTPKTYAKLERKLTLPYTSTYEEGKDRMFPRWLKIKGRLIITRNSYFHTETLSDEDLEEIGGVEYRALRMLGYVVAFYVALAQLIPFIILASWLSRTTEFDSLFQSQFRLVPKAWFVAFNVVGAYTGGGMSLVDTGMVPFQETYVMIFLLGFVILAGNHALPIFLRFTIWCMSKFVKSGSKTDETLHFLLDHPRRCYLYMFPSEVTWFLTAALVFLTALELFTFCVLDIGLSVTDSLPVGTRIIDGIFQGLSVRASGFAIVNLSALAPATLFLYVVMMYISIYPVALSMRSTNVYEERSLGIFEEPVGDEDEEPHLEPTISRRERVGKYIGWHIRRQLSFDLWWLVIAVWLVCIIERAKILDEENFGWFNTFRILFEMVSAYSTIGLTLGIPTENFSFSGSWSTLSKLVIILVMIRGRHRGLPVAVDRAVLLPKEYKRIPNADQNDAPKMTQEPNGEIA